MTPPTSRPTTSPGPAPGTLSFPEGFLWGAATSAFQVEGDADARGRSIWDDLCDRPGAIATGDDGRLACRHVDRLEEDLALMRGLGLGAYRFSVSWPRVMPDGTGAISERGLGFYDRLVDGLLGAGVRPFCTLYHWDLPSSLQDQGGWLSPEMPGWFADYAGVVAERLGDRVRDWITLNEPQVFLKLGLQDGIHAPGLKLTLGDAVRASHHAALAHLLGTERVRASAPGARVGPAPVAVVGIPASDDPGDAEAARAFTLGVTEAGLWNNTWHLDPVLRGRYPEDGLALLGRHLPAGWELALESLHTRPGCRSDFIGLNLYSGVRITRGPGGEPTEVGSLTGAARTSFGWPVEPRVMELGPAALGERYGLPMYITENGLANNDWVALDGRVDDPQRIDFTTRYLGALQRAIENGADVRGYFHWSLMDNFEWAEGFGKRFGLVHVDFATGHRTPKRSSRWYAEVCRTNAVRVPAPEAAPQTPRTATSPGAHNGVGGADASSGTV